MKNLKNIITKLFSINSNNDSLFKNTSVEVSEVNGIRSMHIGSVTIQSSMNINSPYLLELDYTQAMALVTLFLNNPSEILFVGSSDRMEMKKVPIRFNISLAYYFRN